MVNLELLKQHASQYKLNKNNAGEFHRQLFTMHKDIASYYNAEDIDPDVIPKSQKFVMYGMQELMYFFKLPQAFGDERKWQSSLSVFKDHYEDLEMPISEFNKTIDAFLAAMEIHAGGVTDEQRSNWQELLNKGYEDMKKWGWY